MKIRNIRNKKYIITYKLLGIYVKKPVQIGYSEC